MKKAKKKKECFYCEKLFLRNQLTRDHVIPKAAGGQIPDNVVLSCAPCNVAKGDRLPSEAEISKFIKLNGHYPGKENGRFLMDRWKQSTQRPAPLISQSTRFYLKIENQVLMAKFRVAAFIEQRGNELKAM